jgi:hyperosmotically inducible protein
MYMQIKKLIVAATVGSTLAVSSLAFAADGDAKPKQSVSEYVSDSAVTTKVKAAIVGEPGLSALDISVSTRNGTTTLSGAVASAAQADLASKTARAVKGVKQVKNLLKVDSSKG